MANNKGFDFNQVKEKAVEKYNEVDMEKVKKGITLKRVLIGAGVLLLLFVLLSSCSDDRKEAYNAVRDMQEEYEKSNKKYDIEYEKYSDLNEGAFVEGKNTYGEKTFEIIGKFTYDKGKYEEYSGGTDGSGGGIDNLRFDAYVALVDGEYIVTDYFERLPIRRIDKE